MKVRSVGMKLEIYSQNLMVVPETIFEKEWLESKFEQGVTYPVFWKTGAHTGDRLGLMIKSVIDIEK
jgi:hypothetical protein